MAQTGIFARKTEVWDGVEVELTAKPGVDGIRLSRRRISPLSIVYPSQMPESKLQAMVCATELFHELRHQASRPVQNPILDGRVVHDTSIWMRPAPGSLLEARNQDQGVVILIPEHLAPDSYPVQRFAYDVLKAVARHEAKRILPAYVKEQAARLGVQYGRVTIKDMESRWGSCSSYRNLNFSLFLMLCPWESARYTVLHELCHLTHLHHGEEFWALLSDYLGENARVADRRARAMVPDIPCLF